MAMLPKQPPLFRPNNVRSVEGCMDRDSIEMSQDVAHPKGSY